MPLYTTAPTMGPAPLESDEESWGAGYRANMELGFAHGPVVEGAEWLGGHMIPMQGDPQRPPSMVSHDDAVKKLSSQGYDTTGVPADGIPQDALDLMMQRQSTLALDRSIISRSNLGSVGQFTSWLIGGSADPANIALTLFGGPEARALTLGRGTRLVVGAAAGAGYTGAYTLSSGAIGHALGDPDISMQDTLRTILFGTAVGGGLHVALGGKQPVLGNTGLKGPLTLGEVAALERSAAAARAQGVSEADVVSPKGAVGRNQVMPNTATEYGFDASRLHDPAYNDKVGQAVLNALQRDFPNDPEAQAIGYNAGPGKAREWINSGRNDATLRPETQGYLARLRQMRGGARILPEGSISQQVDELPPETRTAAATTAVAQFAADSNVNVEPVIARSADEGTVPKAAVDTTSMAAPLQDAVPKPNSAITDDPVLRDRAPQPEAPAVPIAASAEAAEHTTNAVEQATTMAKVFGQGEVPTKLVQDLTHHDEAINQSDEFVRAVQAAVRCGLVRGFD